jgi:hypothetical protein
MAELLSYNAPSQYWGLHEKLRAIGYNPFFHVELPSLVLNGVSTSEVFSKRLLIETVRYKPMFELLFEVSELFLMFYALR